MLIIVILTGLACGILLVAAGFVLWDGFRPAPGLSHVAQVLGWLAGTLLLVGALLAWFASHHLSPSVPPLILMAAVAAPPRVQHRHGAHWDNALLILPALALAGAGLFWTTAPPEPGAGGPMITLARLALAICGGFGARALGRVLSEMVTSLPHGAWPSAITYALLTLLVGSMVLANLWQRGSTWGGAAGESGLAAAWLAWSTAWVSPRRPLRLQAILTAVAALFLIVLAAGYSMLDA